MQVILLLRLIIQRSLAFIVLISIAYQSVQAHTVIEPAQITEGKKSENYLVITHGCGDNPVIGSSIVFPDGVDSTITTNGNPYSGTLSDFVTNWGNIIQLYQDRSVFNEQDTKGNVTGFWAGGGRTIASHLFG